MRLENSKWFITGAAGFIASHLIARLEADGHEVWGCDISFSDNERIRRIDVADFGGMERMIQFINPHFVVHLANFGNRYPDQFSHSKLWETNVIGTEHILELQKCYGFDLIYSSSSEIYGTNAPSPVYEHYEGDWWYNDYAASKYLSEKLILRQIQQQPHLRALILRLFGIYGPNQPHTKDNSVVAQFIDKIQNDKPIEIHDAIRCFLYVDDCVEALLAAAARLQSNASPTGFVERINIGSTEEVRIEGLAKLIETIVQKPIVRAEKERILVGVRNKLPAIGEANLKLGWKPAISLWNGLGKTINGAISVKNNNKSYGIFVSVDGESKKPRRLSCAERCSNEELVIE